MIPQSILIPWVTGHFRNPKYSELQQINFDDLGRLKPNGPAACLARRSLSEQDANYPAYVRAAHGEDADPTYDGEIGPAVAMLLNQPRCWVPDYPLRKQDCDDLYRSGAIHEEHECRTLHRSAEATGPGNWKSCHNVGNFHCRVIRVDETNMPAHLKNGVFRTILKRVIEFDRSVGVLDVFVSKQTGKNMVTGREWKGKHNIDFSFVTSSRGWIGLAIVQTGIGCTQIIWCKYLATYRPSDIVREWTTLILHELGHNAGFGHERGGVMNPSIVRGLNGWAPGDPTTPKMTRSYGGVYVPLQPWEQDEPTPGPGPGDTIVVEGTLDVTATIGGKQVKGKFIVEPWKTV